MQSNYVVIVFFMLISTLSTASLSEGLPPLTHKLTKLKVEIDAPSLRQLDIDEEWVDIKKFKGKTVVVNFWATWCPPCRREMGSLERLYRATKDKNVVILAVNVGEDIDTVFSFMATIEPFPSFHMLFDSDASSLARWKVKGLPTTYIVNADGRIVYRAVGGREFDHQDIQKAILSINK